MKRLLKKNLPHSSRSFDVTAPRMAPCISTKRSQVQAVSKVSDITPRLTSEVWKYGASKNVRFTGVDQFDGRAKGQEKLHLIDVHRKLQSTNAKTQLVPGDLQSAVSRIANSHVRTDLIVISSGFDQAELEASWFYFPRMLHSRSLVLIQHEAGGAFTTINRLEIEKLADQQSRKRGIAA